MLSIPTASRNFLDAGVCIGALMRSDPRFAEANPIVQAAQRGDLPACASVEILSEIYAALTWAGGATPLTPAQARLAVAQLIEPPSEILVLRDGLEAGLLHLQFAAAYHLTARRIHDARHAATALQNGITRVYTYAPNDWSDFAPDGIVIAGPPSVLAVLSKMPSYRQIT